MSSVCKDISIFRNKFISVTLNIPSLVSLFAMWFFLFLLSICYVSFRKWAVIWFIYLRFCTLYVIDVAVVMTAE